MVHNEEFHNIYKSCNIRVVKPTAVIRWAYRIFLGTHLRKHALGRQRRRWENKIKMDYEDWK
jgi:hypothetical protein